MKRSSTSGSLLSLSQWLHTHSSSAPSPCCLLSAGPGSPSLRKSCCRDSPMTKCLKSWTEGKSILYMAVNRGGCRGGEGGSGGGGEGCGEMHAGMLMFSWGLSFSPSPPFPSPHLTLGASQMQAAVVCQSGLSCEALFVSVLGTASDTAHRSQMGLLSLYSSVGLAEGSEIRLEQWACRRGTEREERREERRGKVNKDGTGRRGCIRDGLLGSVY